MPSATLKSIAKATGFSVTTVSRALAGYGDVNEATRRLIMQEAQRQGYVPNQQARALQKQLTQTIGLVLPNGGPRFPNPFFEEFVSGIGSEATAVGFDLLVSTASGAESELDVYRRLVGGRRVDGLVLMRTWVRDARVAYLATTGLPYVVFGRTESADDYVYIDVDGVAGQRALTEHLIALGHRRIAYITPPLTLMFAKYRMQGYHDAMADAGLPLDERLVVEGDLTERDGKDIARRLLQQRDVAPPTAIMTGNDSMAIGAMKAIQECGLRVGEDVAVGGYDDVSSAEHLHPGLTTVRQPIFDIGQRLTRMLLELIAGRQVSARATLMRPELVIRGSTVPERIPDEERR
ncbi:MAG: LacI family DNA-binding transcriptional regulator [Anaerolineae bacterium]|nr:LacI family DNA-binding transcriptional regulator [Anaerolineae bacterium]